MKSSAVIRVLSAFDTLVGDARPDWSRLLVIKRLMTDIGLETQDASDDSSKFLSSQQI